MLSRADGWANEGTSLSNTTMAEQSNPSDKPGKRATIFAVTSGKGGVGKTSLSVNMACEFSRRGHRTIIIDTPPIVPFTDADAIGVLSDGLIMVARAGKTRRALFQQAIQSVTSTRVLGAILNDATFNLADRENYVAYDKSYYDYYNKDRRK